MCVCCPTPLGGMVATSGETELCGSRYLQDDGATPLYVASQEGHDAVVTELLASGAAVNQARTVGVGVLRTAGRFAVCSVDSRCCAVSFFGTWVTFVSRVELVCCGLKLCWYCVFVVLSGCRHGGNEW